MSIYIGDKEIKDLCIGDSSTKEVYLGDIKVRPSTFLKSYEEIVAMATAEGYQRPNTIAELNQYSDDYYNKFNQEGHLFVDLAGGYAISGITERINQKPPKPSHTYGIHYQNGTRGLVTIA